MRLTQTFRIFIATAIGMTCSLSASATPLQGAPGVLVPAYFYPTLAANDPWNLLDQAASQINVGAILNPNNGRFDTADSNYLRVDNNLRAAGGKIYGYVQTNYGHPRAAGVYSHGNPIQAFNFTLAKHDIDQYLAQYHVDGFFIDEMSTDPGKLSDYADFYHYIKSKDPTLTVIGNTGVGGIEGNLTQAADVLVNFEDYGSNYASTLPPNWASNFPTNDFVNLVHDVASVTGMQNAINELAAHHANDIYVTDLAYSDNPWRGLPSYWNQEVNTIAALTVPEPGILATMLIGISALALSKRRKSVGPNPT